MIITSAATMTRARLNVLTVVMVVVPSDSFHAHGTGKIATRSSRRLAAELGGERCNLSAGFFERARAVDFLGGVTQFFLDGKLGRDAAAGLRFGKAARNQAFQLLLGLAPRDDEAIELLVQAGFDEQRGFDERGVADSVPLPFVELPEDDVGDARVHDGVQAVELGPVGKNNVRELDPVDAPARIGDGRSELAQDLIVCGLAPFDQSVGQRIGVEDGEAHFAEHGGDGALSAGNSARESESEHFFSDYRAMALDWVKENLGDARRRRAAFTVLLMSMAMVIGPTPPGTGVSAPAVFVASG